MRLQPLFVILCLVALSWLASPAVGAPIAFNAILSGPAESPPNNSPGTGIATVTYDAATHLLSIQATFSGLTAPTTVAHIHASTAVPFAGNVGVAVTPGTLPGFPAGVTSGAYSTVLDLTLASTYTTGFVNGFGGGTISGAEAALAEALGTGRAYFNIHTSAFPAGEIRGFLVLAPEPASLAVWLVGGLAIVAGFRRQRKSRSSHGC